MENKVIMLPDIFMLSIVLTFFIIALIAMDSWFWRIVSIIIVCCSFFFNLLLPAMGVIIIVKFVKDGLDYINPRI